MFFFIISAKIRVIIHLFQIFIYVISSGMKYKAVSVSKNHSNISARR